MKEAKEYFTDMERHRIPFEYTGPDDDAAIVLVSLLFIWLGMVASFSVGNTDTEYLSRLCI